MLCKWKADGGKEIWMENEECFQIILSRFVSGITLFYYRFVNVDTYVSLNFFLSYFSNERIVNQLSVVNKVYLLHAIICRYDLISLLSFLWWREVFVTLRHKS